MLDVYTELYRSWYPELDNNTKTSIGNNRARNISYAKRLDSNTYKKSVLVFQLDFVVVVILFAEIKLDEM